jgi:ABC-type nitrate/sulfonate/bicarbonate transport system substrate-binding protein
MLLFFTRAVDLAYVGMVPFTLGLAYGLPLRVAGIAQAAGPSHGVVLKNRVLEEPGAPLRVATVFGSSGHFVGWNWARTAGIEVMFVDLPPQDQVRAFHQGYIQGIASWEPHLGACIGDGSELVFSATDLPFTLFDLLVTSEDAAPRASDVDRVAALHRRISAGLADAPRVEDIEYLAGLFGTRWSHEKARRMLRAAFISAASEDVEQYLDDIGTGVAAIREFGAATGLGTSAGSPAKAPHAILSTAHWERMTSPMNRDELRVGYSDDLMCAPLLLGRLPGLSEGSGVTFVRQVRREVERVAGLSDTLRESVEQARDLIAVDPALATMKMARLVELNLRVVADHVLGANAPKQVSAVIAALEERGILPPLIATSAHWIRSVRNVAAHEDDLSEATAAAAMTHLLDILEWLQASGVTSELRCPRCSALVQPDWVVCPNCTWRFERTCERCGLAMDASWKACPSCGSSAPRHESSKG